MLKILNTAITIVEGDITKQAVDAIVNAANSALAGGGGVDGAIHRAGGPAIMAEIREKYPNSCLTGSAVITGAGNLSAKWIIHAVGPVWRGGNSGEYELLAGAYRSSLRLASDAGATSIAFPGISTGVYGFPASEASQVALDTAVGFVTEQPDTPLREIRFVAYNNNAFRILFQAMQQRL